MKLGIIVLHVTGPHHRMKSMEVSNPRVRKRIDVTRGPSYHLATPLAALGIALRSEFAPDPENRHSFNLSHEQGVDKGLWMILNNHGPLALFASLALLCLTHHAFQDTNRKCEGRSMGHP